MKRSSDYCNPSDFEDSKDWFKYCYDTGTIESLEDFENHTKTELPFKDNDANSAYLDGYLDADNQRNHNVRSSKVFNPEV